MMYRKILVSVSLILFAAFLVIPTQSEAMPNFARRYNVDCSMCHTAIPKLNKAGYEFRLAGYRFPSDIGKEETAPFNLADLFAARFQAAYTWKKHNAEAVGGDYTDSQLEFKELTLYPLTGSWGKYFGSIGEFSMAPDETFETENAYVRGVYGDATNGWWQARIGVMHPWEGFGASDRPIGTVRPLFQKGAATNSPFFLWNIDEMAAEAGYHMAKTGTSIAVRMSNGITDTGEPAQGGALIKSRSSGATAQNDKSYQLFINQFITDTSAVSLYYYYGRVPQTVDDTIRNTFQRFTGYANYWVLPDKVNLLAAYSYGHDYVNKTTTQPVGNSYGYMVEADYHQSPELAYALRYDYWDPSKSTSDNQQTAWTLSANYYILHGLQVIGDYQHKKTDLTTGGSNKDDTISARMIFIW